MPGPRSRFRGVSPPPNRDPSQIPSRERTGRLNQVLLLFSRSFESIFSFTNLNPHLSSFSRSFSPLRSWKTSVRQMQHGRSNPVGTYRSRNARRHSCECLFSFSRLSICRPFYPRILRQKPSGPARRLQLYYDNDPATALSQLDCMQLMVCHPQHASQKYAPTASEFLVVVCI